MQIPFFRKTKLQTPTQLLLKSSDVGLGRDSAAFLHPHAQLAETVNTHEVTSVQVWRWNMVLFYFKVTFYQILLM